MAKKKQSRRKAAKRSDPVGPWAALTAGKKGPAEAINLLIQDHQEVESLFLAYERSVDSAEKVRLAERICLDLKAHTWLEEKFFYPAVRKATGEDELIDHALEEHAEAKKLVSQIESALAADASFDALMVELREAIDAHVSEEEDELFPATRKTDLDLYSLGNSLAVQRLRRVAGLCGKPDLIIPEKIRRQATRL